MPTSEDPPGETRVTTFYDPKKISRARILAGLKQKWLAERIGISAAHLCNIEKGNVIEPGPNILALIARHTGRTVADFEREPADVEQERADVG